MKVTLIGMGLGTPATMTEEGAAALARADLIIGARRLVDDLGPSYTANRRAETKAAAIWKILSASGAQTPCVIFSGDTGFYSGSRTLLPLLWEHGVEAAVLPGISSVQYLSARLGRPWQDWTLVSAHGVKCNLFTEMRKGKPVFFLTGGALVPGELCAQLTELGLGGLAVTVGEKLSYPEERICTGTARDFAHQPFAPLSVLLAEAMEVPCRAPGLPDDAFIRGDVPMTKQEVRAAILAKLAVRPSDVCWDVGAGTGSVSVELALQGGEVWATERKPEACQLIRQNRERFQALNLHVVEGCAPEGLDNLPKPDAVFVGGSGGNLEGILRAVHQANPQARLCVSAIALETLEEARRIMAALSYETEITQIAVSRTKAAGGLHLLMAQNPVFLISGVSQCED